MTTRNTPLSVPVQSERKPTLFRKVVRYLQDQALEHSSAQTHLVPPGREPQQRRRQTHTPAIDSQNASRTLSEATTAIDRRHQLRSMANSMQQQQRQQPNMSSVVQDIKRVQYAQENLLQSYEVSIPERATRQVNSQMYWIIYIHGGYFRDPKVDATSFRAAMNFLAESSPPIAEESESESQHSHGSNPDFFAIQHNIAGFVSINYRLSPHVAYPQDPDTTPRYEMRIAQWPDQIDDILAALRHLQTKHEFGSQYILSGHSVGAQLAFLAALRTKEAGLPTPKCVLGCNGIYDFPAIHQTNPPYESMTRNAMDPQFYESASPALSPVPEYIDLTDQGTTNFVLSHSHDDGLVVWDQVEIMKRKLDQVQAASSKNVKVKLIETKGSHNLLWEEGRPLALVIKEAINMVLSSTSI